jgi:hypothetical protein
MAGDFTFLHSVSLDSKGNLFTGETIGGRRIQTFVLDRDDGHKGRRGWFDWRRFMRGGDEHHGDGKGGKGDVDR